VSACFDFDYDLSREAAPDRLDRVYVLAARA
jgi:hypothetical protein